MIKMNVANTLTRAGPAGLGILALAASSVIGARSFDTSQISNDTIAFVRSTESTSDILVMDADGGNQIPLTDNPEPNGDMAWSPDGARIAFISGMDDEAELYVMDADGTNMIRLTDNLVNEESPEWSPNGQRIAFVRRSQEMHVIDLESRNEVYLASISASTDPAWSPDGSRFAYAKLTGENKEDIYVVNVDSGEEVRLTNHDGFDWDPAWSPDGSKMAFRRYPGDIYVIEVDGGEPMKLTTNPDFYKWGPAWSPDGKKIAFTSAENIDDGPFDIYTVDADGGMETNLTGSPSKDLDPAWSPDGSRIAFESDRDGNPEIYVMDAEGANQTRLTNNPDLDQSPSWKPSVTITEPSPTHGAFPPSGGVPDDESRSLWWLAIVGFGLLTLSTVLLLRARRGRVPEGRAE